MGSQPPGPGAPPSMAAHPRHLPELDSTSYTAHRLHHATAPHLHLTSRRIFVGPIPNGWLKSHHADWFKDHVHYSKRHSTFSAEPGISRQRRVTGLEGYARRGSSYHPGLWVDTDATTDAEDERNITGLPAAAPEYGLSPGSTRQLPQLMKRKDKQREEHPPPVVRTPKTPTTPGRHRPKTSDTSDSVTTARTRPKTTESLGFKPGESFSTAHEDWGGRERSSMTELPPTPLLSVYADYELDDSTTMYDIREVAGEASTISEPPSTQVHDSLASLLRRDRDLGRIDDSASVVADPTGPVPGSGSPPNRPTIMWKGKQLLHKIKGNKPPDANTAVDGPPLPPQFSANRDRVAGGLVRFNTAVDAQERDNQMKKKLAHMSRSRSLKRAGRRSSNLRKREGEIVKMDNMIVRVESARAQLSDEYDENESLKVPTRAVEKWREYVVVCRETSNSDVPMSLRLYKSRTIPAVDRGTVSTRSVREIPLNPKTTRANLYSSLDKTLVIWLPYKRGTLIYIMRPRCASTSVEWYAFLRAALGEKRADSLTISVPDLVLTIRIENPFARIIKLQSESATAEQDTVPVFEEKAVAGNVLRRALHLLEGVDEWADIIAHWKKNERIGLTWRRYDRLEWIHGANEQRMYGALAMQKTHELELRPKVHYPTEAVLRDGKKMTEPCAVEGFLIRLSSSKGRQERLGRLFQKRLYFMTHDRFLFFCRPSKAMPPAPPKSLLRGGVLPPPEELGKEIPLIYGVTPYCLDEDGRIQWLEAGAPELFERKDYEAYAEAERKVNLLLQSEGIVDLTEVVEVRRVIPGGDSGSATGDAHWDDRTPATPYSEVEQDDEKSFEILLENKLVLKLQCYDVQTRDEWMLRLKDLVKYWKARFCSDVAITRRVRNQNLQELGMDEEMESIMGQFGRKWEVSRTYASSELYNVCGLSSCRTITMAGILYRKPRKHATFRRYNVVLCNGTMLVFDHTSRTSTGKEIPTVYHERHLTFSLRDCYVYSGLVTESDLLYHNQTFDSNTPGRHALPRIYSDGFTAHDEDLMTCFVLWRGSRRRLFTKNEDGNTITSRVTSLGTAGNAVVFKTRSRVERDAWVMSISMEIERLNSDAGQDIKVTPPRK